MNKKHIRAALPAVLFTGLLAFLSAANAITPQKDFSDLENRELSKFPAVSADNLRTGAWMKDFESYASDQFLLRSTFMEMKTAADFALQKKDNSRVYFGRDGYLFSTDEIDGKQEASNLKVTADFLSRLRSSYPQLRLSALLAPTAKTVMSDKLPAFAPVSDEREAIDAAKKVLSSQVPNLIFTDPSDALCDAAERSGNSQLYYRTDHHWTVYGAYTAYRQWAFDHDFTPANADDLQMTAVSDSFLGTNQAKAPGVSVTPDTIFRADDGRQPEPKITVWKDITKPEQTEKRNSFYDSSFLKTKDQYGYFLGGNDPQVLIETGVKNGRSLLLIKDSYANCFVPFLARHYERILITDLRYSHGRILLPEPAGSAEALPVTDILFLYNIESFAADRNLAYLTQLSLPEK